MTKYVTSLPVIAFTHEGNDYILHEGQTLELPDCDHVKNLVAKGNIKEAENVKPPKNSK